MVHTKPSITWTPETPSIVCHSILRLQVFSKTDPRHSYSPSTSTPLPTPEGRCECLPTFITVSSTLPNCTFPSSLTTGPSILSSFKVLFLTVRVNDVPLVQSYSNPLRGTPTHPVTPVVPRKFHTRRSHLTIPTSVYRYLALHLPFTSISYTWVKLIKSSLSFLCLTTVEHLLHRPWTKRILPSEQIPKRLRYILGHLSHVTSVFSFLLTI